MQLKEYTRFHSRYELIRKLGSGGFSEVWLAEDTKADRMQVALKVYASAGGLDEEGVQIFSHEFSLLFDKNHMNLLRPNHYDEHERRPYLIMPFCENGSAKRLIGEITEEAAWRLLHDVAAGLAYLHSRSTPDIHQDIKPENILINDQGEFLITDFGISTNARSTLRKSAINQTSQEGGTIDYMGPERFGRTNEPIKASDIWSLGVTMFELLEGRLPFPMGLGGLAQKGGAEIPEMTGKYSKELKGIIYKMLAKETWDRPTAEVIKREAERHLGIGEKDPIGWKLWAIIAAIAAAVIIGAVIVPPLLTKTEISIPPTVTDKYYNDLHGRSFVYSGEVNKDGIPHGVGTAIYEEGIIYIDAETSEKEGACTYEGRFSEGYREGQGKLQYSNISDYYDGRFSKNYFNGLGIYTWGDGNTFNGEWKFHDVWNGTVMDPKGEPLSTYKDGKRIWSKYN